MLWVMEAGSAEIDEIGGCGCLIIDSLWTAEFYSILKSEGGFDAVCFCRLVTAIGDAYGIALLLHMLTSTVMLTLLAYQATKVRVALALTKIIQNCYVDATHHCWLVVPTQINHLCLWSTPMSPLASSIINGVSLITPVTLIYQ